ncbi:hypothetical protein B0H34DRAFT_704828 [Crassisporium funariophilum]|nr:hypothetical protein B0H34DRAFT_704828 [Crassisporium funariophilum]
MLPRKYCKYMILLVDKDDECFQLPSFVEQRCVKEGTEKALCSVLTIFLHLGMEWHT